MIWLKKEIDARQACELSERFGIDMILASILVRRGVTAPEELQFFLENDVRFLHNPFLFKSMERAVDRLEQAIRDGEKIQVYGDRDVDGITATVVMVEALAGRGVNVSWKVPLGDDDYGLSRSDVEEAAAAGINLLVTVDCGVSNVREIELARSRGIEVIVIDHHNPQSELPAAWAIINPKVEGSGYPFPHLSGCGVAGKVDWALAFARTVHYKKPVTLLQVIPQNESFTVEAVRLANLIERDRFRENVVPGVGTDVHKKLKKFTGQDQILAFDLAEQRQLIEKAFGRAGEEMALADFRPLLEETFPQLLEKSLLSIREMSRVGKYAGESPGELDIFKNLYVSAVLKTMKTELDPALKRFDLAALGTIADLMPLVNENRIIVAQGLSLIASCERKGLRELLAKRNLVGKEIAVKEIAWQVTPVINASGRLGEPDKAVELLLGGDREKLVELTAYLCRLNERRKDLGDDVWKKMFGGAEESFRRTEGKFVLVAGAGIRRGITGILATKMVKHFKAPVCVVAELEQKAVGSLRSIPSFPLKTFLQRFTDLFTDYGGHDLAAGFNLPLDRLDVFKTRFYDVVRSFELPPEREENILIDAEISKERLTPELFTVVSRLSPYGEAHPPVSFYTAGLQVESCDVVGKKEQVHLKLLLGTGRYKFPSMLWNGVDLYGERFRAGEQVDIVYRMQKNVYMNTVTLQLIITDIARSGEKTVKTLRLEEPYFDSAGTGVY